MSDLPKVKAVAGWWKHGEGESRPVIRILKRSNGHRYLAAAIDYDKARALADQIHDLCDEYEKAQRDGA